jgi:adenylate cyclase
MEIERKWLVDKNKIKAFTNFGYRIEQHYLNDLKDDYLIRVRDTMGTYTMTLKGKGLMIRTEFEFDIDKKQYEEMVRESKTSLKKTRFFVEIEEGIDRFYEIDVFDDYDFIICEVEFETEEDAYRFIPPTWCLEEVTEDPTYTNINLAK